MIKSKPCTVDDCNYPRFAKGYCKYHQNLRSDKKSKSKPVKKPTGEKIVFEMIYEDRPHISFISGLYVDCIAHTFAHILPKGLYPKFRLRKDNIVFLTPEEHHLFDFGSDDKRQEYKEKMKKDGIDVDWDKLYKKRDELLAEYNDLN